MEGASDFGAQWGPDLLGEFQEVFYWELVGPFAAEAPDFRPKSMWFLMEETHGWQIIPNLFRYVFFLEDALLRRPLVVLRGLTGTAFAFESIQTERERGMNFSFYFKSWIICFFWLSGLSVCWWCWWWWWGWWWWGHHHGHHHNHYPPPIAKAQVAPPRLGSASGVTVPWQIIPEPQRRR